MPYEKVAAFVASTVLHALWQVHHGTACSLESLMRLFELRKQLVKGVVNFNKKFTHYSVLLSDSTSCRAQTLSI